MITLVGITLYTAFRTFCYVSLEAAYKSGKRTLIKQTFSLSLPNVEKYNKVINRLL